MYKYQFIGTIYPADLVKFDDVVFNSENLQVQENGVPIKSIKAEINKDSIRVTVESEHNFDSDLETLRNSIQYFCRGLVNASNYYFSTAIDVEIQFGGNTSGQLYSFSPRLRFMSYGDRPLNPLRITELSAQNPLLQRAIGQAIDAVRNPIDTGFHCFRAIEAIRQSFRDPSMEDDGKAKKDSWIAMGNALRIDRGYYAILKDNADITRHGGLKDVSGTDIKTMLEKAWKIIDRYLLFIDGSKKDLDNKFEILK